LPIVLYNPLAWERLENIRLPVETSALKLTDENNKDVAFDLINNSDTNLYTLVFQADLPPVGYRTYYLTASSSASSKVIEPIPVADGNSIENQFYQITFGNDGRIASVLQKSIGQTYPITQDFLYYISNPGDSISGQASGAYIFRPDSSENTYSINQNVTTSIQVGAIVQEAEQVWADWAIQSVRLYSNSDFIEIVDTIGPIPIDDGHGKEIISRITTNLQTDSKWFTDAQGHEYQTRVRNFRPTWNYTTIEPVAGNYYPVNEGIYITDGTVQLSLVNDRSAGGSSMQDGELELMVHRRCLVDDGRGVGEPLNESTIVRSTKNLIVNTLPLSDTQLRTRSILVNHPVVIAFGPLDASFEQPSGSALTAAFPDNVHLQSLETQSDGSVLLRLHHPYAVDEASPLAQPVTIDVSKIFATLKVSKWTETQLTGVIPLDKVKRLQWNSESDEEGARKPVPEDDLTITLNPMETRTFVVSDSNTLSQLEVSQIRLI